ncbi:hypothetical protein PI125_g16174 [Phytophthora idaei]|nr:hypothetical protein PI125_g16174 [Phytophthora idaei]
MGLLESDEENRRCLSEATLFQMAGQLRHLFAVLLVYCDPAAPAELWSTHLPASIEDYLREEIQAHNQRAVAENRALDIIQDPTVVEENSCVYRRALCLTLQDVNSHLTSNGQSPLTYQVSLTQFSAFGDVETVDDVADRNANQLIASETSYETDDMDRRAKNLASLNADQRMVFDKVMAAVVPDGSNPSVPHLSGKLFFVGGPGGAGKSFLLDTILASVRRTGRIELAVAGSGIAVQLLTDGCTAHTTFRLPLNRDETSTCNIGVRSFEAALLKRTSLIVLDEAPMTYRFQYEAVDRTLRDLLKNDMPFGGVTMLLSGDFRQTLPVIPRAGPAEVIAVSLKRSSLWRHFETLRLTTNMRVHTAIDNQTSEQVQAFADCLLRIGDERHGTSPDLDRDFVEIPRDMLLDGGQHHEGADHGMDDQVARSSRLSRLIETVYADFNEGHQPDNYFAERVILTPKNADVLAINDMILDKLPGDAQEYRSVDTLDGDDELERQERNDLYPPVFLDTISLSGMPPHKLRLKIGTPVMLIRNINTKEGFCNGTRLWVVSLRRNYMQAVIMGGAFAGKKVLIPRIALICKNSGFPFERRRKQFPVQVAFAMTINKSQGQSIQILGLYLPEPVFSHGQFYVAVSRVTARQNITILAENPATTEDGVYTKNIVYREIVV